MPTVTRKHVLIAALLVSQTLVGIIGGLVFASTPRENVIFPGVFINSADVGGLSVDAAGRVLSEAAAKQQDAGRIVLRYKDRKWVFTYRDLGVKFDVGATLSKALQVGREPGNLSSTVAMFETKYRKPWLPFAFTIDETKMDRVLRQVADDINVDRKDAQIVLKTGRPKLVAEVIGRRFRVEDNKSRIKSALGQLKPTDIEISVSKERPTLTVAELRDIRDIIGVGVTTYSRLDQHRGAGIPAIAQVLNGRILKPGEVFSFNRLIGQAVKEKSYLEKPDAVSGRMTDASSGSACQVASTLYQAVLYSGLEIKERHAHLGQPEFIKLGQDAAVNAYDMDLKFRNTSDSTVYINATAGNGRLVVNLLGIKVSGQTIQVVTRETETKQPALTGPMGSNAKVFRVYYRNGEQVRRVQVSEDDYK